MPYIPCLMGKYETDMVTISLFLCRIKKKDRKTERDWGMTTEVKIVSVSQTASGYTNMGSTQPPSTPYLGTNLKV